SGLFFFFSSRRRHTSSKRDWSSDVCSSDLSPPSMSQDSGPSLNDREVIIEEADLHFSQITSAEPKSDDVDRMTFHDNGVVTMENDAGELLVYNRIDEGDMERPDIRDEMVDNWMEREHDDYAHRSEEH